MPIFLMLHNRLSVLAKIALSFPQLIKRTIIIVFDSGMCFLATWLAFYLRLGDFVPLTGSLLWPASVSIILVLTIFTVSGLYKTIYRFIGTSSIMSLTGAMLLYGIAYSSIFTFYSISGVPRTIGFIQPIVLLILLVASRIVVSMWLNASGYRSADKPNVRKALIYGAGAEGRHLASVMALSSDINVLGFLDDDKRIHGRMLNGYRVYDPAELAKILTNLPVTDVLLAMRGVSRRRRNEILESLKSQRVAVRTLPNISDLATGKITFSDLQELDIDDLLGREPVRADRTLLTKNTKSKTVLVTGAGGSIGSELCRQIITTNPKRILLVDISEYALYCIHQELESTLAKGTWTATRSDKIVSELDVFPELGCAAGVETEVIPLLASVSDEQRMNKIISTWKPDTIYHAAAYKHVPLVEHNPLEALRTNVFGTLTVAEAARRNRVQNFVLVSTDKAVRPTNVMGATKRLAEMVLQALADEIALKNMEVDPPTIFTMVRFGNVLGSSGSVVPLFRNQIKHGGPVTLTHPDVVRYFMTIREAAQLVIQAGAMGRGGDVFLLDMGEPVRIMDLARRMVELSGLTVRDASHPIGDIEIKITGLRPGEKLFEELLIGDNADPTNHPSILRASEQFLPWSSMASKLEVISIAAEKNDIEQVRALLEEVVNGYQPSGALVDWVYVASKRTTSVN